MEATIMNGLLQLAVRDGHLIAIFGSLNAEHGIPILPRIELNQFRNRVNPIFRLRLDSDSCPLERRRCNARS